MRTQRVFESWDCTPARLPPRSRLYALEPIGVGTPFVESLSSYVVRLADAHAVSVGDLVGRELSRVAPKPLISFGQFMKQNRANSHGFYARTCSISGFGKTSERWIEALERATLRTTLRFLTFSPFSMAPSHGRAVCHVIPVSGVQGALSIGATTMPSYMSPCCGVSAS